MSLNAYTFPGRAYISLIRFSPGSQGSRGTIPGAPFALGPACGQAGEAWGLSSDLTQAISFGGTLQFLFNKIFTEKTQF